MKERLILFSAPMVRAILAGRKTQTRRIMKSQPYTLRTEGFGYPTKQGGFVSLQSEHCLNECHFGKKGDRLWVRESFLIDWVGFDRGPLPRTEPIFDWRDNAYYRADGECCEQIPECCCAEYAGKTPWRNSLFMPRWASRITLEITEVRVQRLQDISEEDAKAEGIERVGERFKGYMRLVDGREYDPALAVTSFSQLWETIHGDGAWQSNPWVWAITFKVVKL